MFVPARRCTPLLLAKLLPAEVAFWSTATSVHEGSEQWDVVRSIGEGSVYFDAQKDRWIGAMMTDGRRYKVVAKTKTKARKRLDAMRHANAEGRKPALRVSGWSDGVE